MSFCLIQPAAPLCFRLHCFGIPQSRCSCSPACSLPPLAPLSPLWPLHHCPLPSPPRRSATSTRPIPAWPRTHAWPSCWARPNDASNGRPRYQRANPRPGPEPAPATPWTRSRNHPSSGGAGWARSQTAGYGNAARAQATNAASAGYSPGASSAAPNAEFCTGTPGATTAAAAAAAGGCEACGGCAADVWLTSWCCYAGRARTAARGCTSGT